MADTNRAEAVREVPEPVLGQAEECSCGARLTEPAKPWCLAYPNRHARYSGSESAPSPLPVRGLYEQWKEEFKPLLGKSGRWEGFCYLMRDQLERERPVIVETGTLREPGNWAGDGQSTRLWQWVMEHKTGCAVSVDLDLKACELARRECSKVHVICQDSPSFLRGFMPFATTLLYLDSRVHGPDVDLWMHQVAELTAIWERLPSGCLIASDDNAGGTWKGDGSPDMGKPVLTRRLFEALGIAPEHDSYIVAWRKP